MHAKRPKLITALKLKIGNGLQEGPLEIPMEPSITVLVGPNNSGKSLLLREMNSYCVAGSSESNLILDRFEFQPVDEEAANRDLEDISEPLMPGQTNRPGFRRVGGLESGEVHIPHYIQGRTNPSAYPHLYATMHASRFVRHLDGNSRLNLIGRQQLGSLKKPGGLLARLLVDDGRRAMIRERVHKQLGLYLALDITDTPTICVRLGDAPPPIERSFTEETLEYMRKALDLSAFSDGVNAFVGMMIQIHVGLPKIITVDEPEAFLAPPLAHALGKELASGALQEGKQVFASTHSPHFLMGAIASGAKVHIIRLTYDRGGVGTARLLPAASLNKLMNDPMLRSSNVLSALFYRGVIVGEAEADRAFYQECNERMLAKGDARAARDTLFLNANGKDVIPTIIEPLRRLGIPTASVVDLDVLKKGGEVWTRHLKACGLPLSEHQPFGTRRQNSLDALNAANPEWKTRGGIAVLSGEARTAVDSLLRELAHFGLFVVGRGELEAWLSGLDAPRSKQLWLREIFGKMGSDPALPSYVSPGEGDVWDFLGGVGDWLKGTVQRSPS